MKKSIVISLLTVATLCCTALCSFASTGVVTTDTLKLRKEASTESTVIALLSVNDKVEIIGEEYGWYKVKSKGYTGYVASQYISVLTNNNTNTNTNNEDASKDNENQNTESNTNNENQTNNENNDVADNVQKETVKVLATNEKIYITPVINSLVIDELKEEKQIEVVSEINGWSYIKFGTTTGWVRTEKIQSKEIDNNNKQPESNNNSSQKVVYISGTSVNFRKAPNTSAEIIAELTRNAKLNVIEKGDGWYEVEYNGQRGFVSTTFISETPIEVTSRSAAPRTTKKESKETTKAPTEETEVVTSENVTGADIVSYARNYLGYKYTSGGATPSRGFDCSGFTTYVYKHFGISLSRTSSGQNSNGMSVSKSEMKAGDIICFSGSSGSKRISHVGIYIGGGKFIHAANSRQGVIISNVSGDGYYFVSARRIIK